MPVFLNPSLTTFGTYAVTTVTAIGYNLNRASGNFSGDNDAFATGWVGAAVVSASLQMGDIDQAKILQAAAQAVTLAWTAVAAAGGTNEIITMISMSITAVNANNPHNANSGCTVNLVYVGPGGATSPIAA